MQLSVVTAVSPSRAGFLPETAASIAAIREVIELEWFWSGMARQAPKSEPTMWCVVEREAGFHARVTSPFPMCVVSW